MGVAAAKSIRNALLESSPRRMRIFVAGRSLTAYPPSPPRGGSFPSPPVGGGYTSFQAQHPGGGGAKPKGGRKGFVATRGLTGLIQVLAIFENLKRILKLKQNTN